MNWKWLRKTLVIALVALIASACSSSREALRSSSELRVEGLESVQKVDSVVVVVRDTIRETTTITIREAENGDTLRVSRVTDRDRSRSMSDVRSKKEEVRVIRDTVYVEKRDSSFVKNTNFTNGTNPKSLVVQGLKWIFWIIVAIIALTITITITKTIKNWRI